MAVTIRQTEGPPEYYPDPPDGLSTAAAAIDQATIWQRIESYIAARYSVRDVEWLVEGCGDWCPPLKPATVATIAIWRDDAWQVVDDVRPSPTGYVLAGAGPYRFAGTVGLDDDEVPGLVLEAYRRLAEYLAAVVDKPGLRSENIPGIWSGEFDNRAKARALQDSGAADLLRNFRRA